VARKFGTLNVLVNNAGIAGVNKPTHEVTRKEWEHVMDVNVTGVFYCTKHAIPLMRSAGGGSIINLSSIYGLIGAGDLPPYHASKGRRAADEQERCAVLCPGPDQGQFHPSGFHLDAIGCGSG